MIMVECSRLRGVGFCRYIASQGIAKHLVRAMYTKVPRSFFVRNGLMKYPYNFIHLN